MKGLRKRWLEEIEDYKDAMSSDRKRWMENLLREDQPFDIEKARVISGYLMALRDCGRHIGDLKYILEEIIEYYKKGN